MARRFQYAAKILCTATLPRDISNHQFTTARHLPDGSQHP